MDRLRASEACDVGSIPTCRATFKKSALPSRFNSQNAFLQNNWLYAIMRKPFTVLLSSVCCASAVAQVRIAAVGDVMLGNRLAGAQHVAPDFLENVRPHLADVDIAFANLEGPVGGDLDNKKTCRAVYCHTFSQVLDAARTLRKVGFNLVSVANNHAQDLGTSGMHSTKAALRDAGIGYAGHADEPITLFSSQGRSFALVAFSANVGLPDYRNTTQAGDLIRRAKAQAQHVLVSLHGGCEGNDQTEPPAADERCFGENRGQPLAFAKWAIDQGADVVLGHGPHVPRGILNYHGRLILLSLGNFATARGISVGSLTGVAPLAKFTLNPDGSFSGLQIVSFRQVRDRGPQVDPERYAERLMTTLSARLAGRT